MDDLFQRALTEGAAEQSLRGVLCTDFPLYAASLQAQNVLAFIYLKNMTNYLIKNDPSAVRYITSHRRQLTNLIYTSSAQNFEILLSFYDALSVSGYLWPEFCRDVAQNLSAASARTVRVYSVVFRRYEVLKGSEELYLEINDNIELLKDRLFGRILDQASFSQVENVDELLNIFYFLIYQDIHPYFESNMDRFFLCFGTVFERSSKALRRIFVLCISKYSDCVDVYGILRLCLGRPEMDAVIVQILKRRDFPRLRGYYEQLAAHVLQKRGKPQDLSDDPLGYTRSALCGPRDEILAVLENTEFKRILFGSFPGSFADTFRNDVSPCLERPGIPAEMSVLELERLIDVCAQLKTPVKIESVISCCSSTPEGQLLLFTCVRYLLVLGQRVALDPLLAETHPSCAYIVMHYLSEEKGLRPSQRDAEIALRHLNDEYSSRLLFLTVRASTVSASPLGDRCLGIDRALIETCGAERGGAVSLDCVKIDHARILGGILGFLYNLREVGNTLPYFYLFDTLGLLASSTNYMQLLKLANHILTRGTEELYHLCFYLLSLLVKFGFDASGLLEIIRARQDLWAEDTLVLPMCCLLAALDKGAERTFVHALIDYLLQKKSSAAYFLIARTTYPVPEIPDAEERLCVGVYRRGEIDLSHVRENYISPRNVRKVVKALFFAGLGGETFVRRNLRNYCGDRNIPYSVCEEFGI